MVIECQKLFEWSGTPSTVMGVTRRPGVAYAEECGEAQSASKLHPAPHSVDYIHYVGTRHRLACGSKAGGRVRLHCIFCFGNRVRYPRSDSGGLRWGGQTEKVGFVVAETMSSTSVLGPLRRMRKPKDIRRANMSKAINCAAAQRQKPAGITRNSAAAVTRIRYPGSRTQFERLNRPSPI
ncbi:uncharacterized protein EI97DRAFT_429008 [Westerdykella ornata]|uniref:Uncharacterized protein n=1 Tax=Westerdykella ornata TaxID=318751 RepID=A0A6A6JYT4_WESOR|nr:uncharacterized protein EI97DRAFT_429008 [Westerdykella ornata]KAF2280916.1 hypothetical protein EI97DRAFT_429008 [Westerdykella ornata]